MADFDVPELKRPKLARREPEAMRFEELFVVEVNHVQAVADEPRPVYQVPIHADPLVQRPERSTMGVVPMRTRQVQARHQRHGPQPVDAAAEEQSLRGRGYRPQIVVIAGTTSEVAAPDKGVNYPNFVAYFGNLAAR